MTCQITPDCPNPCEGTTNGCASCNHALRKAEREAAKVKVRKPPKKVSAGMSKKLVIYKDKKAEHLAKHPDCQARLIGCNNNRKTNTVHHCAKRGKNINNEETFLTVCDNCHYEIEFVMSAKDRRLYGFLK